MVQSSQMLSLQGVAQAAKAATMAISASAHVLALWYLLTGLKLRLCSMWLQSSVHRKEGLPRHQRCRRPLEMSLQQLLPVLERPPSFEALMWRVCST